MLQKSLPQYRIINSCKGGDTIGGGLAPTGLGGLQHHAQYFDGKTRILSFEVISKVFN